MMFTKFLKKHKIYKILNNNKLKIINKITLKVNKIIIYIYLMIKNKNIFQRVVLKKNLKQIKVKFNNKIFNIKE